MASKVSVDPSVLFMFQVSRWLVRRVLITLSWSVLFMFQVSRWLVR